MTPWLWVATQVIQICLALAAAWPLDTNMVLGVALMPNIRVTLGSNTGHGYQHRLGCGRTIDPDIVFGSSLDPDVTMASVGTSGHSDQCGSSGSVSFTL